MSSTSSCFSCHKDATYITLQNIPSASFTREWEIRDGTEIRHGVAQTGPLDAVWFLKAIAL